MHRPMHHVPNMNNNRNIEWMLPVHIVARELKKYNARESNGIPCGGTWPTYAAGIGQKRRRIENIGLLTTIIIKYKRRERWEIFKAANHAWIDKVKFDSQNISQTVELVDLNSLGMFSGLSGGLIAAGFLRN